MKREATVSGYINRSTGFSGSRGRVLCFRSITIVLILGVLLILYLAVVPAFAGTGTARDKYYTQVCIDEGDSLWSIAQSHITPEYDSSSDYITEVMSINHLTDADCIHAGNYLVVPYYE